MTSEPLGERVAALETEVEHLQRWQLKVTDDVLPDIAKSLDKMADEFREIRERVMTRSTDYGWIVRILYFVLQGVITPSALLWLGYLISNR
jgi:hypothetical protein